MNSKQLRIYNKYKDAKPDSKGRKNIKKNTSRIKATDFELKEKIVN